MTVTYLRPQVAPALITYLHEVSFDLQSWRSSLADVEVVSVTPMEGGVEEVIVRALTPIGNKDPRIFLRVTLLTP